MQLTSHGTYTVDNQYKNSPNVNDSQLKKTLVEWKIL